MILSGLLCGCYAAAVSTAIKHCAIAPAPRPAIREVTGAFRLSRVAQSCLSWQVNEGNTPLFSKAAALSIIFPRHSHTCLPFGVSLGHSGGTDSCMGAALSTVSRCRPASVVALGMLTTLKAT